jgi:hypothetical protein
MKIKGVLLGDNGKKLVEINPNSKFSDPEFGTKYNKAAFIIGNFGLEKSEAIECKLDGQRTNIELKLYNDRPTSRLTPNPMDTTGVAFDAIPGGKLDSIKIAVYRSGTLTGKIYKLPLPYGVKGYGYPSLPISKLFTATSNKPIIPYPYPYPHKNWLTIDLRNDNISTNDPFYIGIATPIDTANFPILMNSRMKSYSDYIYCHYAATVNQWLFAVYTPDRSYLAFMVSAYVSVKDEGTTKVVEVNPIKYSLSQNYPNPFNPETNISFSLPKKGLATLKIYDVMGREVKTLMNEVKEAGDHIIKFSAENFSSGVYFYKIKCDDYVDTKKMVLVR